MNADRLQPEPEVGQIWSDQMYDADYEVKYVDEKVVLLRDTETEHTHLYGRDAFDRNSERSLYQAKNRFQLENQ